METRSRPLPNQVTGVWARHPNNKPGGAVLKPGQKKKHQKISTGNRTYNLAWEWREGTGKRSVENTESNLQKHH